MAGSGASGQPTSPAQPGPWDPAFRDIMQASNTTTVIPSFIDFLQNKIILHMRLPFGLNLVSLGRTRSTVLYKSMERRIYGDPAAFEGLRRCNSPITTPEVTVISAIFFEDASLIFSSSSFGMSNSLFWNVTMAVKLAVFEITKHLPGSNAERQDSKESFSWTESQTLGL